GVEVLGLLAGHAPAAEADDTPLQVPNGEEQAPAEAVVEAGGILSRQHEARRDQLALRHALLGHVAQERIPTVRGVAQSEAARDLEVEAPALDIGPRLGALLGPERVGVELGRQRHDLAEALELAVGLWRPLGRQLHAGPLGQGPHRLRKGQAVLPHQEAEGGAAHAAAEAVEDASLRIDREGGGLFGVEGAEALPVFPGALEVDGLTDQLGHVHPGADLVEDLGGEAGGHQLCPSTATVAPAPPSCGSPGRWLVTSGWGASSSSTARRGAPVPLPWVM